MADPVIRDVAASLLVVPLPEYMRYFGYDSINVPFVRLRDSDGREGTGFAYTLDIGASVVCDMVNEIIGPAMIGKALSDWDTVSAEITAMTRRLGATTFVAALSAVDIAIWDLRAIVADVPLFAQLAGSAKSSEPRPVPFYGSGRGGYRMTTDELVEHSAQYLADGFDAVKLSVGVLPVAEDALRVRAVRDALGAGARIMVDGSEHLSLPDALTLGAELESQDIFWFEEPLLAEQVDGYRVLSERLGVPIATGEHFQQTQTFERYLRDTDVAFYQPDAALGGGLTGMLAVARLAEQWHRPIAWHSLADLHIHLGASVAATCYVEDFPILDGIIADPLRPVNGMATAPQRPGHGIRWDDSAIRRYTVASRGN